MTDADLDVLTLGMMMGEVAPPRAGAGFGDGRGLVLFPSGSMTIFALAWLGWDRESASSPGSAKTIWGAGCARGSKMRASNLRRGHRRRAAHAACLGQCRCHGKQVIQLLPLRRHQRSPGDATRRGCPTPRCAERGSSISVRPACARIDARRNADAGATRARLGLAVCYTPNYRASAWSGGAVEAADVQRHALALADVVLMNAEESELLSGVSDPRAAARRIIALGPSVVVITSGREGAIVATDGELTAIPAIPVDVVFDIGAGDSFHAGFLAAWRPGGDPLAAAPFAAHAAALKISREPLPELLPTRDEVVAAMEATGARGSAHPA